MSTEDNKALVRRFYGESVHTPTLLDELLAPTTSYIFQVTHPFLASSLPNS